VGWGKGKTRHTATMQRRGGVSHATTARGGGNWEGEGVGFPLQKRGMCSTQTLIVWEKWSCGRKYV